MVKFPYNVPSDWLKQCALSEIGEQVDDIKLAFTEIFALESHPLRTSNKININELFVSSKYGP